MVCWSNGFWGATTVTGGGCCRAMTGFSFASSWSGTGLMTAGASAPFDSLGLGSTCMVSSTATDGLSSVFCCCCCWFCCCCCWFLAVSASTSVWDMILTRGPSGRVQVVSRLNA